MSRAKMGVKQAADLKKTSLNRRARDKRDGTAALQQEAKKYVVKDFQEQRNELNKYKAN